MGEIAPPNPKSNPNPNPNANPNRGEGQFSSVEIVRTPSKQVYFNELIPNNYVLCESRLHSLIKRLK